MILEIVAKIKKNDNKALICPALAGLLVMKLQRRQRCFFVSGSDRIYWDKSLESSLLQPATRIQI